MEKQRKRIGVDESGKGDYFGYLVIAGVAVDEDSEKKLRDIGVKDSKKLSDYAVRDKERKIKKACGFSVVKISPEKYNTLYGKFNHNLNKMLAWGHAQVIENLAKSGADTAISDKFEHSGMVKKELVRRKIKIDLVEKINGENDIAVAAASILARAEFLRTLKRLSLEVGIKLPKGSAHVDASIKELREKYNADNLEKLLPMIAKMHFKTTKRVMKK